MTPRIDTNFTETTPAHDDCQFGSVRGILASQDEPPSSEEVDDELANDPIYATILGLVRAGEADATVIRTVVRKHRVAETGLGFLLQAARAVVLNSESEPSAPPTQESQPPRPRSPSPNLTKSPYSEKHRRERSQRKQQKHLDTATPSVVWVREPPEDEPPTDDNGMFISTLVPTQKQKAEGLFLMPGLMRAVLLASAQGRDKVELAGATYTFNIPIPTRRRFRQAFLAVWKALSKDEWMADLDDWGKPEGFSINVSGHLLAVLVKGSGNPPSTVQAREMGEFVKMLDSLVVYEAIPGRGSRAIGCFQISDEPHRQRKTKIMFHPDLIRIIRNRNNMIPVDQKDFKLGKLGTILRNVKRGTVMKYQKNEERVTKFLGAQDRFIRSLYPSAETLKRSLKQQMNRLRSAVRQLGKIAVDAGRYLSVSLTNDGKIVSRLITV